MAFYSSEVNASSLCVVVPKTLIITITTLVVVFNGCSTISNESKAEVVGFNNPSVRRPSSSNTGGAVVLPVVQLQQPHSVKRQDRPLGAFADKTQVSNTNELPLKISSTDVIQAESVLEKPYLTVSEGQQLTLSKTRSDFNEGKKLPPLQVGESIIQLAEKHPSNLQIENPEIAKAAPTTVSDVFDDNDEDVEDEYSNESSEDDQEVNSTVQLLYTTDEETKRSDSSHYTADSLRSNEMTNNSPNIEPPTIENEDSCNWMRDIIDASGTEIETVFRKVFDIQSWFEGRIVFPNDKVELTKGDAFTVMFMRKFVKNREEFMAALRQEDDKLDDWFTRTWIQYKKDLDETIESGELLVLPENAIRLGLLHGYFCADLLQKASELSSDKFQFVHDGTTRCPRQWRYVLGNATYASAINRLVAYYNWVIRFSENLIDKVEHLGVNSFGSPIWDDYALFPNLLIDNHEMVSPNGPAYLPLHDTILQIRFNPGNFISRDLKLFQTVDTGLRSLFMKAVFRYINKEQNMSDSELPPTGYFDNGGLTPTEFVGILRELPAVVQEIIDSLEQRLNDDEYGFILEDSLPSLDHDRTKMYNRLVKYFSH